MATLIPNQEPSLVRRIAIVSLVYVIAYFAAAYLDLYTTGLALQQPGTTEGNVYATNEKSYSSATAWLVTGVCAPFIVGSLLFGLLNARHVSQRWLRHPVRSFAKFYIIPWRKRVLDRSPLHMASFAIAFVPLRLLAAGNNLLIYRYGTGPLGSLVGIVSNHTSPTFGFWIVLGPLFYLLAVASSPLAAYVIRRFQHGREIEPGKAATS
jgi:MFS family permease